MVMVPHHDLLIALEAIVRLDGLSPGFSGSIFFGVRQVDGDHWLSLRFGARAEGTFVTYPSSRVDAMLVMGEGEAEAILQSGGLPARRRLFEVAGDRLLLQRFVKRYLGARESLLSVRVRRKAAAR